MIPDRPSRQQGPPAAASAPAKLRQAIALQRNGHFTRAEALYRDILVEEPANFDALHLMGVAQYQQGRYHAAIELIRNAIGRNPEHAVAYTNLGAALQKVGRFDEALASYDRALLLRPDYPEALLNRGNALQDMGRHDDALVSYDRALFIKSDHAEAFLNRGNALRDLKRFEDALASFERALSLKPGYPEALLNCGELLQYLKRHEKALACYEQALALKPNYPEALNNRGAILHELNRHQEALASLDSALALKPGYAEALNNRGAVLQGLLRHEEALASYDRALELKRDYARALHNRGTALAELQRYREAARSFAELVDLDPAYEYALGNLLKCRLHCCEWENAQRLAERVALLVEDGARTVVPFSYLAMSGSPASQLRCSRTYVVDKYPAAPSKVWKGECYCHDRIRVAYLSADFHEHATAYLMAGLFELHDPQRFEITAVSFGPDIEDPMRARLRRSFSRFVDVRAESDGEVARMLRDWEIDIAVDLKGFTASNRMGIFSLRPAPLQVSYLGYPGTVGAEYIDYIIADRYVIPTEHENFYTEKVVRLPDSYQVNDSKRRLAAGTPSRATAGLPDTGFVFCCFNNCYKITPNIFDIWMRLLDGVVDSVLWLLEDNSATQHNLRREARQRGVNAERLIFAPRVNLEEHLVRQRLADLFLDTLPYNAHTTASDALCAGLPVLTSTGTAFAGRVAGSLLMAMGLPELIARNLRDYEALARQLATTPSMLSSIRAKLARNRCSCSLFDTDRFRRHIELAYVEMWERHQRGEPCASFAVRPAA